MAASKPEIAREVPSKQLIRNSQALSNLYSRWAPTRREARPNSEVYMMACLARCNYTLATVLRMEQRDIDCMPLVRCLYEHSVTFAWVAIDPDTHHRRMLAWELAQRRKMTEDLAKFGAVAPPMDAVKRSMIDADRTPAPELADRALHADRHWQRSNTGWAFGFRRVYANLYRPYSALVHPTAMGLEPFVSYGPGGQLVGDPPPQHWGETASAAGASFADALIVASLRLGWPPLRDVVFAWTYDLPGPTDA